MHFESTPTPASHRIQLIGTDREFSCAPGQDVLNASIRAGVGWLPVGCRGGGCGVCRVIVCSGEYVAGRMSKRHVAADGAGARFALACRVYPASDLIVELAPIAGSPAPLLHP